MKSSKKQKSKSKKVKGKGKLGKKGIEKLLLENIMLLEKNLTEVTASFKLLEKRLDKLFGVFEKAANFVSGKTSDDKKRGATKERVKQSGMPLAEKLDLLVEQNKAMAEGLLLLEKFIKERIAKPRTEQEAESDPLADSVI